MSVLTVLAVPTLAAQTPTPEQRIAAAVLPLPAPMRQGAGVVAFGADGSIQTLKNGTNEMVCIADRPGDATLDVRCYHTAFMPLIARVEALAASHLPDSTLNRRIDDEVEAGTLKLPIGPTAGYRMFGPIKGYDPVTNTTSDAIDRWQSLHMPYATGSDLGVSVVENGIEPYMMSSGTYWAHVMIMEKPLRY